MIPKEKVIGHRLAPRAPHDCSGLCHPMSSWGGGGWGARAKGMDRVNSCGLAAPLALSVPGAVSLRGSSRKPRLSDRRLS